MTITHETTTSIPDSSIADTTATDGPDVPGGRRRTPTRVALGWAAVVVSIGALAVLTSRFLGDDGGTSPSTPAAVADPKDRVGYRSPTIQRDVTTGDPKDHATHRPALTAWEYTTGDAKDHAPYRPPLTSWEYTTGDAKDHAGERSPSTTP